MVLDLWIKSKAFVQKLTTQDLAVSPAMILRAVQLFLECCFLEEASALRTQMAAIFNTWLED